MSTTTTTPAPASLSTVDRREAALTARRAMRGVGPAQVEAMRQVQDMPDGDLILSGLMAAVLSAAGADTDAAEVACLTVSSFYVGATGEGVERTLKAARAALKAARRTVTLAALADDWDQTGDMTEVVDVLRVGAPVWQGQARIGVPDRCATTTTADVVDMAVESLTGAAYVALRAGVDDFRAHAHGCDACDGQAGRRVTLTGVTAHVRGVTARDAEGKRLARAVSAGLAQVDRDAILREVGPVPGAGESRQAARMVAPSGRDESVSEPITVTLRVDVLGYAAHLNYAAPAGVVTFVRDMTEAERVARKPAAGERMAPEFDHGQDTAPIGARDRRACVCRDADTGFAAACRCDARRPGGSQVRAFKPVVSPRKRAAGSTGPTVPVTLSR